MAGDEGWSAVDYGNTDGGLVVSSGMEFPPPDELADLPASVSRGEDPWVVTVSVIAAQNSVVSLTWDEVASSAGLRWVFAGIDRMRLEWELVAKVDVRERDGQLEFSVVSRGSDFRGELFVQVRRDGEVTFSDILLRG